jgi:hypothetical protein
MLLWRIPRLPGKVILDTELVICTLLSKLAKCYNEGYAAYNRLSGIWRLWSVHSCPHWRKVTLMDTLFTGYGYQRYIACNLSTLFNIGEMLQWRTSRLPGKVIWDTESMICPLLSTLAKCYINGYTVYLVRLAGIRSLWSVHSCPYWQKVTNWYTVYLVRLAGIRSRWSGHSCQNFWNVTLMDTLFTW